tara:strand:+ start:276 stop:707 length:432 start_codon:yes stop_codon:yes gene_type:complete
MSGNSRPQEGDSSYVMAAAESLNSHELNKMNMILEEHYKKKQSTILEKPLGEVIDNTINFFAHSFDSYSEKVIEAEAILMIDSSDSYIGYLKKHLTAFTLFIRDDENIIYLGILLIILSVLICFFNISRSYGTRGSNESGGKS